MEDTKKTVLAGNGEKDVPRAVYDGVLTINVSWPKAVPAV